VTDRNGSAFPVWVDVTNSGSIEDAFAEIEAWRKVPDVLVNSAGIMRVSSVVDCAMTKFRTVMDVKVTGAFLCTSCCQRHVGSTLRPHRELIFNKR
jgi:NAD(P)-dependent dehydrogenase (short-subunit alcohol dehydrogenase family)